MKDLFRVYLPCSPVLLIVTVGGKKKQNTNDQNQKNAAFSLNTLTTNKLTDDFLLSKYGFLLRSGVWP